MAPRKTFSLSALLLTLPLAATAPFGISHLNFRGGLVVGVPQPKAKATFPSPSSALVKEATDLHHLKSLFGPAGLPDWYLEANHYENEDSLLQRFLHEGDYDVKKTKALVEEDMAWRQRTKIKDQDPESLLGCSQALVDQHFFSTHLGNDVADNDSPVIYRSLKNMRTASLLEHTTVDRLVDFNLYEFEQHCRLLYINPQPSNGRRLKYIIDIDNMEWGQFTGDLMSVFKGFVGVCRKHHPQRLAQIYVVNSPKVFSMAYKLIKPLIAPGTRHKIHILSKSATRSHPFVSQWLNLFPTRHPKQI